MDQTQTNHVDLDKTSPGSSQPVDTSKTKWNIDLFSTQTIEECEAQFEDYCERRIEHLAGTKDKLSILRSCIELLERLESKRHSRFAGRVLIFLARVLPFFDQSGLNQKAEFCSYELPERVLQNIKKIGENYSEKLKTISQLTDREFEEGETLSDEDEQADSTSPLSHQIDPERIYENFWKVQNFLNQPNLLFDKANWLAFRTMVDTLITHLETIPPTCKVWKLSNSFMTDPRSFNLQLNDINLRRCFLVQIMILLRYFDSTVDQRPEFPDKLQSMWMKSLLTRIVNILQDMPTRREGLQFLGLVSQITTTEDYWTQWKNEKCREPKKPVDDDEEIINMGSTYHKRRKLSDELKSAKPYNMQVIGSPEMTRLWNRKPQQLFNAPDVTKYFNQPPEKQMESFKDPNTNFRILRLLRKSPFFFVPTASVIQTLDGYLKALADKHFNGNSSSQLSTSKATTPNATPIPTPNTNSSESTPNDTNSRDATCLSIPNSTSTTTTPTTTTPTYNGSLNNNEDSVG